MYHPGNERSALTLVKRAQKKKKEVMKSFFFFYFIRTSLQNLTVIADFRKGPGCI